MRPPSVTSSPDSGRPSPTPESRSVTRTPFVFVGNNAYNISVLDIGQRARLDSGQLSLYMVRTHGRLHMFWLMVRAILQRLEAVRDFETRTADKLNQSVS